jgi:hypothetical protein
MNTQKISFKVPPDLWAAFTNQTNSLFLTRAPFLNHMIDREIPELAKDLAGRSLSSMAKRYISSELQRNGAKSVNIEIAASTAAKLNQVVRDGNLVRDAFLCRLIIFLRGNPHLLKYLEVPLTVGRGFSNSGLEGMPTSPLKAMEAVRDDPLYYIRDHLQSRGDGIYDIALPRTFDWAACFLEDAVIPKTNAFKADAKLAEQFELLEANAFANPSNQGDAK